MTFYVFVIIIFQDMGEFDNMLHSDMGDTFPSKVSDETSPFQQEALEEATEVTEGMFSPISSAVANSDSSTAMYYCNIPMHSLLYYLYIAQFLM